ncbi:DUF885 domain-containing protein [Agriterribacter sp.]|uniref:DUF885 domain-containing protein n=1 Tax=Agriterribacter sp. TaxID=2821509 RepID=UPI002BEE2815|nr:DUF885 domain-containing protein [Agriterribacter sp.]HRP57134.1 DUF885 domain-containing protein [Agriterribacter sp.]
MKKRNLLLFSTGIIWLISTSCVNQSQNKNGTGASDPAANERLEDVFGNYWEGYLKLNPAIATFTGDNRYNDTLVNDATQAFRNLESRHYQAYLDTMKTFNRAALTKENKINYDIFVYNIKMGLESLSLNNWMMPFNQSTSMPVLIAVAGSGRTFIPFNTVKDCENWLSRIHDFTEWADSAVGNFRKGIKAGVVLPKSLVVKMIPQMQAIVVADPEQSIFYTPVRNMPGDISAEDSLRIAAAYKRAIFNEIVPTYKKLAGFLKNEYLPNASATSGLSGIPGGKEMYTYDIKYFTGIELTPDQVYQTGLDEVAKITHKMDSVKSAIGFKGSLKDLFAFIEADKRFFPFKTPQQVLDSFEIIHQIVNAHIDQLFNHFPKTKFEIRQTEKFREAANAVAQYLPGSPDGSRPGIFYVPIPKAETFNASDMENVFLHEAIPGHHFQMSLQAENTSLPKFRKFGFSQYDAFKEGYAFYCESLGRRLGLYKDPYQYFQALNWQMVRAVRLVIDAGIHSNKMNREQAIQYMLDHTALDKEVVTSEVERYMADAGQALAYMIGKLKIMELRNKYEKELGSKFNIAAFHDELLSGGAIPLKILESEMDEWAAGQHK